MSESIKLELLITHSSGCVCITDSVLLMERLPKRRQVAIQGSLALNLVLFLFLVVIGPQATKAQQPATRNEFWPEIEVYINVKPKVQALLNWYNEQVGRGRRTSERSGLRSSNRSSYRLHPERPRHSAHRLSLRG